MDDICWLTCKLKKLLSAKHGARPVGMGATVGAIASISGGAAAPVTIPAGALIGEVAGWGACQFGIDTECDEKCKRPECTSQ